MSIKIINEQQRIGYGSYFEEKVNKLIEQEGYKLLSIFTTHIQGREPNSCHVSFENYGGIYREAILEKK